MPLNIDDQEQPLPPLYITELVLDPAQLLFKPDEDRFQEGLLTVIKRFEETVLQVENLVPDNYFDAFTRCVLSVFFTKCFYYIYRCYLYCFYHLYNFYF